MSAHYPSLKARVVFVTGGGGGIGAALTQAFHRQGARVAFVDIDDEASQALCDDLQAETGAFVSICNQDDYVSVNGTANWLSLSGAFQHQRSVFGLISKENCECQ